MRNFYVGTNDPRVILCLTRQAEELESRAYTVVLQRCGWRHSVKATPSQNEIIFWRVVNGVYGKAASGLHQVKSGICQGITWGLMSNKYCQALVELRNKPAHELKEVGDQWRTPDNIFWELTPCLARLFWICSLMVITPNVLRITRRKTTRWRMTGQNVLWSLKVLPLVIPIQPRQSA